MKLSSRYCPVCVGKTPQKVVREANFDLSTLDEFAFASRKIPENMHFRLVNCQECDVLFANPAPQPEALLAEYEKADYDSGTEADLAAKTYAECLQKYLLPRLAHRDGAIDIGSGNGSFLQHLLEMGFTRICGVEPSIAPIEAAAPDVKPLLKHGAFKASDFAKESQSLVTCFQTLEHVYDPGQMVSEILPLIRPGGGVFFIGHNYRALLNRMMGTSSPIYDVEHLQLFSPRSLIQLLSRAGFKQVRVFPITNRYPVNYWLRLSPLNREFKLTLIQFLSKVGIGQFNIPMRVGNLGVVGIK